MMCDQAERPTSNPDTHAAWPRDRIVASALVVGAILFLGCASSPVPRESTAVAASLRHPPAGSVIGTHAKYGGYRWAGIPFAQPPVAANRFRASAPLPAWTGTHEALSFGSSCPQYASPYGGDMSVPNGELAGSEDCLFLNVYAPERSASTSRGERAELPVMVWIHGGGNITGTSSFYNGSRLANDQNVIVITVNYRLGFLGWFTHPALRAGANALDASGNFGTLDLIRALEWVQDNVSAFGGNAENVTIFGESAGGWNVVSLMASPLARGLFHRAIVQSGLTWSTALARAENYTDAETPDDPLSSGDALVNLMLADGTATDRESAKQAIETTDPGALAAYLRGKSVSELFAAYDVDGNGEFTNSKMFEDGAVLPSGPLAHAFRPGKTFNRVPVVLGTNKDEEKLFLLFNPEYTSEFFGLVPTWRDKDRFLRDADTVTRIWRVMAVDELAHDLSRAMPGEVFSYRFDWDEEPDFLWFDVGEMVGAAHGLEIPFVFGHWELGPDTDLLFDDSNLERRETLSAAMRSYWAEFANNGHPGKGRGGNFPHWAAWTEGASRFALLDAEHEGGLKMVEGHETVKQIETSILADTTYANLERRCRALAAIYEWAPQSFTADDYSQAGRGLCHPHPIRDILETF